MKKWLALVLAAVMSVSLLSVNVFAATDNEVKNVLSIPGDSLLFEEGSDALPANTYQVKQGAWDADWRISGTYLYVTLKKDIESPAANRFIFDLKLENAIWYFRNDDGAGKPKTFKNGTYVEGVNAKGESVANWGYYSSVPSISKVDYELLVSSRNYDVATVSIIGNYTAGDQLVIPLVTYIENADKEVRVVIDSGNVSTVSKSTLRYANTGSGRTKTTIDGVVEDRDTWELNEIIVAEQVTGSIRDFEVMTLTLQEGYFWADEDTWKDTSIYLGEDLAWGDGRHDGVYEPEVWKTYSAALTAYDNHIKNGNSGSFADYFKDRTYKNGLSYNDYIYNLLEDNNSYGITYSYGTGTPNDKLNVNNLSYVAIDYGTLSIWFGSVKESDQLKSKAYINGLVVYADDSYSFREEDIKVRVDSANENITKEDIVVAKRKDWNISFTAKDVPTLISGRYVGPSWDGTDAKDSIHKAAHVTLQETTSTSWWAQRQTILTLPATDNKTVKGASFRRVHVTDISNIGTYLNTSPKSTVYQSVLYAKENPQGWVPITEDGLYLNDGERHGNITVDYNKITISNLNVDSNKKAKIEFDLWVSIEEGFAKQHNGELFLTIDPSSSSLVDKNNPPSVKIANVVDPVAVTSKISDLKIGYQFQATSDIIITENIKGALLKDKTVRISITDLISSDLVFSDDVKITVTTGDLKIKNLKTSGVGGFTSQSRSWTGEANTSGSIVFDIEKESTVPSTITVSTVGVKLDRNVPVTNKNAYQVLVWGTAIAENYGLYDDKGRPWRADFNTIGESVPYINIVSSANDAASVLTQEVRLTIGQSYYTVNSQTFTITPGAEPYLSSVGSNTMIPLRITSNALGIRNDQIQWDQTLQTATIFGPNKTLQFKIGSSTMIVDGVSVSMKGADGNPVSAELKVINGLGYTFLPYRVLGEAFGIPVTWDAANKTAIYNEGANTNANLANSNTTPVATAQ